MLRKWMALLAGALLAGCATVGGDGSGALVDRAVVAAGGDKLRAVKTMEATGSAKHWEPEQSHVASGEPRFAGESTFTLQRDFGANAARTDWHRKLVYPGVREYRFSEVVDDGIGFVAGVDTTGRTKQSLDSNPPTHAMSRFRAAAAMRELARSSPLLPLQMQAARGAVNALPDTVIGAQKLPTVAWAADGRNFQVMFDPASGLPARVRTLDYDSVQGDVAFDLVLSDWRDVDGVKVAHRQVYQLNGRDVVDTRFDRVVLNPALPAERFAIPAAFRQQALQPGVTVPYQWVIRRQYIGTFLDSDSLAWDPNASQGLRLQDVGPGLALVQGGTHNSLVVELADQLVVFDAPVGDSYSQWLLQQAAQKWPGKPVRTLVLSHHHMDHTAGTRAYVAQGAKLVVGAGNGAHFRRMLLAEHSRSPDLPKGLTREPEIAEVADQMVITDGKRRVGVYALENPHSAGAVIGFVEDAKLGFVTDLWSPGRDPLGKTQNAGQASVVTAVNKYKLAPERFAGGHGSTGSYPELAALPPPPAPAAAPAR